MYKLEELEFGKGELEPYIDIHTVGLHHEKHQRGYLNKLNELLEEVGIRDEYPMEVLFYHLDGIEEKKKEDILFNLGGVLNHNIYFKSISPRKIEIKGRLWEDILKSFNSYQGFLDKIKEMAVGIKGSGYTFLVIKKTGELGLVNFFNQDSPYFREMIPLWCIDVWEHAYYFNYENKRDLYVDNFFRVTDFAYANYVYDDFLRRNLLRR